MEFSITTDNGNLTQKDIENDYSIRVFNEDFIEENFEWNNENKEIEPILILGKESKELEDKLKEMETNKKSKEDTKKNERKR